MVSKAIKARNALRAHAKAIGAWDDLVRLREKLKLEGMAAPEAMERAGADLEIEARWKDWRARKTQQEIMAKGVPLTPLEMESIKPGYVAPTLTRSNRVGNAVMSLPEQVRWVKQKLARTRNGEEPPTEFPSDDVMYWYQIAISRPSDFDRMVIKMESPDRESEDSWVRDGQYQFAEIEKQLVDAFKEAGDQLVQQERRFAEALYGFLPVGAQRADLESSVSA